MLNEFPSRTAEHFDAASVREPAGILHKAEDVIFPVVVKGVETGHWRKLGESLEPGPT